MAVFIRDNNGKMNPFATLAAAIAAPCAVGNTIVVTTSSAFSGTATIPTTVGLEIPAGGMITSNGTFEDPAVLTINGPFSAGAYQCFSWAGVGSVVFGAASSRFYDPVWFGDSATVANSALRFNGGGFSLRDTMNGKTYNITIENGVLTPVEV